MARDVARLFDAMADSYDALEPWYEHFYARVHAILDAELRPPADTPPGLALDAGCGTGFQASRLQALGWRVHGVDVAEALLERARARLPACRLALASIDALPYRDAVFDVAVCCGSTLSFVEAPRRALGELGRVLRPGGRLLLDVEHRWSLDLAWALVSGVTGDRLGYGVRPGHLLRQLWGGRDGCRVEYPGYGRLRLFTGRELRTMLRAAGLEVVRIWGVHAVTNVIPSTVLHRQHLPAALAPVYRVLCALDTGLGRGPLARNLANSMVLLARKGS